MPRRLPDDVVARIRVLLEGGTSDNEISRLVNASRPTIASIRRSLEACGAPYPPSACHIGRRRTLTIGDEGVGEGLEAFLGRFKRLMN